MNKVSKQLHRIMLVGTGSGCGKTTVTCGLLKALTDRGIAAASFKCGPDYIDPMFHSEIIGTKSRNLDLFLCGENTVKYLFASAMEEHEVAVIEGVMGMYDGMGFEDDTYSANHISRITNTPQILIAGVRGKSLSLLAELSGYINFAPNQVKGIILNHCSKGMYPVYRKMIEERLGIKVYGYMPPVPEAEIGSRHLGLVTAEEIDDLKEKVAALGNAAAESLDLDGILQLARSAPEFSYEEIAAAPVTDAKPRIAVARDKAFCFYYADNLSLFERLGAELVYFSPIHDQILPENISGLYFGGGYPEEYLDSLSRNEEMRVAVKKAAEAGCPIFAECGGFMYLGDTISDGENIYPMTGVVRGAFHLTRGLVRFGYKTLTANHDNLMSEKGEQIRCHEFHYSDTDCHGESFTAEKGSRSWQTIQATDTVFAGYPHLHLWGNPSFAEHFVRKCGDFAAAGNQEAGGRPWKSSSF